MRKRKGTNGGSLTQANAILRCLTTMFRWAADHDLIEIDPTAGVRKPLTREISRDRVLSEDEIIAFWKGCGQVDLPFGPLFELLLVTAQRESEIAGMRWAELDLDKAL